MKTRRGQILPGLWAAGAFGNGWGTLCVSRLVVPHMAERLEAAYKLNPRSRSGRPQWGPGHPPLISPMAHTLTYSTVGPVNPDHEGIMYPIADRGRRFLPQPWAAGIRPMITLDALWAWVHQGVANGLLYDRRNDGAQMRAYAAILRLVAWDAIWPSFDLTADGLVELLRGQGYQDTQSIAAAVMAASHEELVAHVRAVAQDVEAVFDAVAPVEFP